MQYCPSIVYYLFSIIYYHLLVVARGNPLLINQPVGKGQLNRLLSFWWGSQDTHHSRPQLPSSTALGEAQLQWVYWWYLVITCYNWRFHHQKKVEWMGILMESQQGWSIVGVTFVAITTVSKKTIGCFVTAGCSNTRTGIQRYTTYLFVCLLGRCYQTLQAAGIWGPLWPLWPLCHGLPWTPWVGRATLMSRTFLPGWNLSGPNGALMKSLLSSLVKPRKNPGKHMYIYIYIYDYICIYISCTCSRAHFHCYPSENQHIYRPKNIYSHISMFNSYIIDGPCIHQSPPWTCRYLGPYCTPATSGLAGKSEMWIAFGTQRWKDGKIPEKNRALNSKII
jgi:hypothetical protein